MIEWRVLEYLTKQTTQDKTTSKGKTAQLLNLQTLRPLTTKTRMTITTFFQGLGKMLVPKRQNDVYQKQLASSVAKALASTTVEELRPPVPLNLTSAAKREAYIMTMLTSLSARVMEGRFPCFRLPLTIADINLAPNERSQPQCLTLVLQAFKNHGGFSVIEGVLDELCDTVRTLQKDGDPQDKPVVGPTRLQTAYAAIRLIINLYHHIVLSRNIVEAPQSTAMASRDRDRDKADYFSPNQFVVELRMAVLPVVRRLWEANLFEKAASSIVKTIIDTLRICLEGEGEAGAFSLTNRPPRRVQTTTKYWKEATEPTERLTRDGYARELAQEALYRCNNNFAAAEEYCRYMTTHERVVQRPACLVDPHPSVRSAQCRIARPERPR